MKLYDYLVWDYIVDSCFKHIGLDMISIFLVVLIFVIIIIPTEEDDDTKN